MLVFEDMVETGRKLCAPFPVEDDLTSTDVAVTHSDFMHDAQTLEHLVCDMLENRLRYSSNVGR